MRDRIFKSLLFLSSLLILFISGGIFYSLFSGSVQAFDEFGIIGFITSGEWNPNPGNEQYGALPFIAGTIATSFVALILCIPFSLPVALFNGEYFRGKKIAGVLGTVVDLLAGIPSVVYGLWGFYVLRPIVSSLGLSEQGLGIFTASAVMAIMIIPYAASLSTEFISMVSNELKEGAYSLGGQHSDLPFRYRKHHGQHNSEPVRRSVRTEAQLAHCDRLASFHNNRAYQSFGQDDNKEIHKIKEAWKTS